MIRLSYVRPSWAEGRSNWSSTHLGAGGSLKKLAGDGPVGKTVLMAFAVYAKAFDILA